MTYYQRNIANLVLQERLDQARTATGALKSYEEMLAVLQPSQKQQSAQDDEPFIDPATRFSTRHRPRIAQDHT